MVFPADKTPANPLVKTTTALANIGNIATLEVVLGEYNDRFRVSLEPMPDKTVFSITAMNSDGPASTWGAAVSDPSRIKSFQQIASNPRALSIDFDGDGKPDIEIYDAMSAPLGMTTNPQVQSERDHHLTLVGSLIAGSPMWWFEVRGGKFVRRDFENTDDKNSGQKEGAGAAAGVQVLDDEATESRTTDGKGNSKEGDINASLQRIAGALTANRQKAKAAGLISDALYQSWFDLSNELIQIGPAINATNADPTQAKSLADSKAQAAQNAATFYHELDAATASADKEVTASGDRGFYTKTTKNKYSGDAQTDSNIPALRQPMQGPGMRLPSEISAGKWSQVTADFDALVNGLDHWIADKQKPGSDEQKQQQYLLGMQGSMDDIKSKPGVMRIEAVFQPDAGYLDGKKEWSQIPLTLFSWKENGKWWLKDITNPARDAFLDRIDAQDSETLPPIAIFQQLDYARHFPKGVIRYQIPGGPGGQIVTTERKHWWEFAQWVGLGLAAVGLALTGFGEVVATYAAVAFAASGVAGAVAAGADKSKAIVSLIAQGIALGSITVLSIKGSMAEISARPTIAIDVVNGIPIARGTAIESNGVKLNVKGGADGEATARWNAHAIDEDAKNGVEAAKKFQNDKETMGWYRKWMEQAEPKVVFDETGKARASFAKGNEPPPLVREKLQAFVDNKHVALSLYERAWANEAQLKKVQDAIASKGSGVDMQPGSAGWTKARPDIVQALGGGAEAETMVARYERFRMGASAAHPAEFLAERAKLRSVLPDGEVDRLRNMFPEYEVYVTGSATQNANQPLLKPVPDIDLVVVVPSGTPPEMMGAIEARVRGQTVRPDPAYLKANSLGENTTLPIDAKVMTPEQFFGFSTANNGRTPLNFTRIDQNAKVIGQAKLRDARQWADNLANSNPEKMTPEQVDKSGKEYNARKDAVADMYAKSMDGELATPNGVSKERLTQAVKGGADGERIPLTYGADPVEAQRIFHELQAELRAVLDSEGITDAVIVQLGSGTTGWSTAPGKTGKAWSPKSDVDFAIFSDQALEQAKAVGAKINPKNQQGGQYTTLKNHSKEPGGLGFYDTPLGKKLETLAGNWNQRIYGDRSVDGFDFKLNLQTDRPFRNAVPVIQFETPVPRTQAASGTRAIEIQGRSPMFGVPIEAPQISGRLPEKTAGRREFHITVITPPEYASLSPAAKAKIAGGIDIPGTPRGRGMDRKDIGDMPSFQMEIDWPEAQEFRKSLGLAPKDLHISLNGGIGKAIEARNAAKNGAPAGVGDDDGP